MNERNHNVEGFRGLLMVWIILFHYTFRYCELYNKSVPILFDNGGSVGVAMFFVISGYYLSHSLLELNSGWKNVIRYSINKYWRLYPAYLISVVLIFIFTNFIIETSIRTVNIKTFLINCLFIYHPKYSYVDGAHWFIASLIKMQIVLGFILLFKKHRCQILLFCSLIFLIFAVITVNFPNIIFTRFNSTVRFVDFVELFLGINLYMLVHFKEKLYCLVVILLCAFIAINTHFGLFVLYFVLFMILISPANIITIAINKVHVFDNIVLVTIGKISFTWYLIHQNIGYAIINNSSNYMVGVLMSLVITFIIAAAINSLVVKLPKRII